MFCTRGIKSVLCVFGIAASALPAVGDERGAGVQDLDILVFVDDFGGGQYEAFIEVAATIPLNEVRLVFPGEPTVVFDSFKPGSFELDLEPDAPLVDFLTADATGETFDLQIVLASGGVSVYRFTVSEVFGPQIDVPALPGFASQISAQVGSPSVLSWMPPAQVGDALVVRGERPDQFGDGEELFAQISPLPFTVPLLIAPAPTLTLSDTDLELPDGTLDEDLLAQVGYVEVLGLFEPVRVSGPTLTIGNAGALYITNTERLIEASAGCAADLNSDENLNFFDVSLFLSAFNSGDPQADFNNDGNINFFDVSMFLSAFNAGCP